MAMRGKLSPDLMALRVRKEGGHRAYGIEFRIVRWTIHTHRGPHARITAAAIIGVARALADKPSGCFLADPARHR